MLAPVCGSAESADKSADYSKSADIIFMVKHLQTTRFLYSTDLRIDQICGFLHSLQHRFADPQNLQTKSADSRKKNQREFADDNVSYAD